MNKNVGSLFSNSFKSYINAVRIIYINCFEISCYLFSMISESS